MNDYTEWPYTLREKYFQIGPEYRIRWIQFFIRIIILYLTIFFWATLFILTLQVPFMVTRSNAPQAFWIFGMLIGFVFLYILYRISLIICTKRCHDFWNDGRLVWKIILGIFIVYILSIILSILDISSIYLDPSTITWLTHISWIIVFIGLLFLPSTYGDNTYGKDPNDTKITLIG